MKRLVPVFLVLTVVACGSSPNAPSAPSAPPSVAPTKIIRVFGSMAFGDVGLGQTVFNKLTIANDGTAPLNYTGLTGSGGITAVVGASPQSGQIPPGGLLDINIRFTPAAVQSYAGTIALTTDATSGTGSIAFTGRGTLDGIPIFRQTGSGDHVFETPSYLTRVRIVGTFGGGCSNFVLRIAGRLLVNEIIGTCSIGIGPRYEGTLLTGGSGGTVAITNSSGVAWSLEEVR